MSLAQNLRFAWQRAVGRRRSCRHVSAIRITAPDAAGECPECVAAGDGWRALRLCTSCGHVGCCDSSKNRHARRHAEASGHPIIRSAEPGEDWFWCFPDARLVAPDAGRED